MPPSEVGGAPSTGLRLVDRAKSAGVIQVNTFGGPQKKYIVESTGSGVALLDYDRDGDLDIFLANGNTLERAERGEGGAPSRLYRNDGDWHFTDVSESAGLLLHIWGTGAVAGDLDGDGDPDLLLSAIGELKLMLNQGDGTFQDATAQLGIGGAGQWQSAALFDYDGDGRLDIYAANYLTFDKAQVDAMKGLCNWKGIPVFCGPRGLPGARHLLLRNSATRFEDATQRAGLDRSDGKGLGVVAADFDGDGWVDLYVANDSTVSFFYRNRGDGTFEDLSILSGAGYNNAGGEQSGMGTDAGDIDGDLDLDLVKTNFQDDANNLYRNDGQLSFTDIASSWGLAEPSYRSLGWAAKLADFDLDGDLDLFVANGHVYPGVDGMGIGESFAQRSQLFLNQGNRLVEASEALESPELLQSSRGAAVGDLDGDGDLDLVVVNMDAAPNVYETRSPPSQHRLVVQLVGVRSNRDAVGAQAILTAGGRKQLRTIVGGGSYLSSSDQRLFFGLGPERRIERLEIRWPSGLRELLEDLPADRRLLVREGEGIVESAALR